METKKILLVDDDPDIVDLLRITLRATGCELHCAYDGITALVKAKVEQPNLIILDIGMPDMDGYTVCEQIKTNEDTKHIPIIVLTVKTSGSDVDAAMEKHADWFIAKPFDEKYLIKKVKEYIDK
jgi:two-component system alkaline phosphatase synthesis response regulator PhoP